MSIITVKQSEYVVLPLRDVVVYPELVATLYVGRSRSVSALRSLSREERYLFVATQKDPHCDEPLRDDLYQIGTICRVLQVMDLQEDTQKILVEGVCRAQILKYTTEEYHDLVTVEPLVVEQAEVGDENHMIPALENIFKEYVELSDVISQDALLSLHALKNVSAYADLISVHISLTIEERQELLEMLDIDQRVERVMYFLMRDTQRIKMMRRIKENVKEKFIKEQEKMLNMETLKAYKTELGLDDDPGAIEVKGFEKKLANLELSKQAKDKCESELAKLKMMPAMSAEASVIRSYLETVVALPWGIETKLNDDMENAQKVLDQDHHGLESVKDVILETMSVQNRLSKDDRNRAPIMCLVGPPGVGKTSLAKSIARATGRDYVRISLGGVRDESEIRGHRKTYIGAMPGRILKALMRAGSSNCLILLDEIDKMGMDFRGDPASALLEVLDPEQNHTFNDHYLELDFDLSGVMFLTTANTPDIPDALYDRMEIIRLTGYTMTEKGYIAKKHLLPKVVKQCGLSNSNVAFSDGAIRDVIEYYTRESGVRDLERNLNKTLRKVVRDIDSGKWVNEKKIAINSKHIVRYLGAKKYHFTKSHDDNQIGCVKGLAWTRVGGDMLSIEAMVLPGSGQLIYTGSLGDVMQESIKTSLSLVKKYTLPDQVPKDFYKEHDIHIHVPEGATPKDGPSAGITISTALLSAVTKKHVRHDVAMTGEVTLHGKVLKIGGLKEKLLAAQREGVHSVLIPGDNQSDLDDIPRALLKGMKVLTVDEITQVFNYAIVQ